LIGIAAVVLAGCVTAEPHAQTKVARDSQGRLVIYDPTATEDTVYYCEDEAATGSHMPSRQCREAEQKNLERKNAQEFMRHETSSVPGVPGK
jgi:hypothetical protein